MGPAGLSSKSSSFRGGGSTLPALLLGLLLCAVLGVSCKSRPNEQYQRAQDALAETMARTQDLSYAHPDFEAVERLFQAVPEDAEEYPVAQQVAREIHASRESAEARRRERAEQAERFEKVERQAEAEARARARLLGREEARKEPQAAQDRGPASDKTGPAHSGAARLDNVLSIRRERLRRLDQKERQRKANYEKALDGAATQP